MSWSRIIHFGCFSRDSPQAVAARNYVWDRLTAMLWPSISGVSWKSRDSRLD
jgi:hypothetical protein